MRGMRMLKRDLTPNPEGLTWTEWWRAATLFGKYNPSENARRQMRSEWKRGVDPTEWARHFELAEVQKCIRTRSL